MPLGNIERQFQSVINFTIDLCIVLCSNAWLMNSTYKNYLFLFKFTGIRNDAYTHHGVYLAHGPGSRQVDHAHVCCTYWRLETYGVLNVLLLLVLSCCCVALVIVVLVVFSVAAVVYVGDFLLTLTISVNLFNKRMR